ncbi:MAG: regulatory protein RecX [Candidatus Omnitrophica bacterium]|nr:regulatory protein RecX [Candidatus Omnitrophota bacterium]
MEKDKGYRKAKNNAYSLLRSRPRSEAEIRGRLKLKGYDEPTVDKVIDTLRNLGEIDDARFARLWVESRMRANPAGDVVLRHELKAKGIAGPIIDSALQAKARDYDEYEIVLAIAKERVKQLAKIDKAKALKRLYDYLVRRGFNYDTVKRVIYAVTDEDR